MSDNNEIDIKEKIGTLTPDNWIVKVDHRSKYRMKINFKLSKDETEAYSNFKNHTLPDGVSENDFIKSVFFLGLSTLEANLAEKYQEQIDKMNEDVEFPSEEEETLVGTETLDDNE